jgi:hypothetical protein
LRREQLTVARSHRAAVARGEYHGKGFECRGVLEGLEVAQPTEAAPGQLTEVERSEGLGVE